MTAGAAGVWSMLEKEERIIHTVHGYEDRKIDGWIERQIKCKWMPRDTFKNTNKKVC